MSVFGDNITSLTIGEKVYQYALEEQNYVHNGFRNVDRIPDWAWRTRKDVYNDIHNSETFISRTSVIGHYINKAVERLSRELNEQFTWRFKEKYEHDSVKHYKIHKHWVVEILNSKHECISSY